MGSFRLLKHRLEKKKWYVFYLRPHSEKVVYRTLTDLDYEVFFPTITSLRIWRNRQKKKIRLPLFPNYLFLYTYEHQLYAIKDLPKVVAFVASGGRPLTVSGKEIEGIKRMLGLDKTILVETAFSKGEHVRILSGPLMGYEGVLVKQQGKTRFGIQLKAINHTIFIDITLSDLEKL
ncbi:UpxY family transcription antiterminator [Sunxiuqinia indica]|uniref:UpxY family transcription antiterminator n=1 Tax=Sunxiuqinia indica TaxID=2692584 RepID=UPI0013594050|nr:UpxY family transcription antiterminator [Sunxiuqinia indica]